MNSELQKVSMEVLLSLTAAQKTIAFAESCTGGLLAKSLTDHAGASAVFSCGVVSYSGQVKHKMLGVSQQTLQQYGEVSIETARQMATGIQQVSGADIGVGVTGIAGPGGGSEQKPVGLVYAAIATRAGVTDICMQWDASWQRTKIREQTAQKIFESIQTII